MKTFSVFRWIGLAALACALAGCATTEVAEVPGTLRVAVNVPPSWNILLDDRVAEAFTDRVREVFRGTGFDHPVEELRYAADPDKVPYLLTIDLVDWRLNRIGNIDCTFHARLQTPRGERDFGLFTNTTMRWLSGRGRWGLAESFEEAAEGAIHELCRAVMKSELLPGFAQSERYSSIDANQRKPKQT